MTRDNNNKLRAIFLASLMFFWLFAGTVAFAGGAAATGDVNVEEIDLSDGTPDADGVTYTVDFSVSEDTDIRYVSVDLSDAEGIDLSQIDDDDVEINDDGGSNVEAGDEPLTIDGDTVIVEADGTQTVGSAETWNVVISDVGNPEAGTYDLTLGLHEENMETGGPEAAKTTATDTFSVGTAADAAGADDTWQTGGELRWQGQTLLFDASNPDFDDYTSFRIIEWDSQSGDWEEARGSTVREINLGENRQRVISTAALEGDYAITAREGDGAREVAVTNAEGEVLRFESDVTSDPYVEVAVQDLDTEFADEEMNLGDNNTVSVDSTRGTFALNVTSEDFNGAELAELFERADEHANDDDVAVFDPVTNDPDELEFNTSSDELTFDLESGNYTFDFEVTDSTGADTANVTIGEEIDGDANFDQAQYIEQRGDIVNITYTTQEVETTVLNIGGQDAGYNASIVLEPNEDGEVAVEFNTFTAANRNSNLADEDYTIEDAFEVTKGDADFEDERTEQDTLDLALENGLYDLIIEADDETELDVAVLNLEEREYTGLTVHTAPSNQFTRLDTSDRVNQRIDQGWVTESDEIAVANEGRTSDRRGDVIVHEIEIEGIEGYLATLDDTNPTTVLESGAFGLDVTHQNPTQNRLPKQIALANSADNDALRFVSDAENDSYYIVAKSDRLQFERTNDPAEASDGELTVRNGEVYNVSFSTTEAYRGDFIRGDASVMDNSDEYEIVDREAHFDTDNGNVSVAPEEDAELTGTTTVAPGTELNVRARATGESPFLKTNRSVVSADGEFAGTFDFSDVEEGQIFVASIRQQSFEDDAETTGIVGEGEEATVTLSDIEATEGDSVDTITVDSAFLPQGGFVTIHDGTLLDGATFDSVRGTSDFLSAGAHSNIDVALDDPYTEDGTAIAMPHQDTNDNEEYDFVTSEGAEDGPYTVDDEAVIDDASVTFEPADTPTATPTDTPTEAPTDTPTATDEPEDDQTGFGAVIALIALIGAALLAARRNAFDN